MLYFSPLIRRSLFVLLFITGGVQAAEECRPATDDKKPQYLVTYGSHIHDLMQVSQAQKPQLEIPVWVKDYKRGWFMRSKHTDEKKMTRLGVAPSNNDRFNGVLISTSTKMLSTYDKKSPCRVKVNRSQLQTMNNIAVPTEGEFWIYQVRDFKYTVKAPEADYQIMQSYIDRFLTNCIQQAKRFNLGSFADACVTSTKNWSKHWANDRRAPLEKQIVQTQPQKVDNLLKKYEGKLF